MGDAGHDAAEQLCWAGPSETPESRVAVAFASGALELRDGVNGAVLSSTEVAPSVRCLQRVGERGLLTVSKEGASSIIKGWHDDEVLSGEELELHNFDLPAPVAHARVDPCRSDRFLFGGGENDLKVWDVEKGAVVWKAKNMKENSLCLRIALRVNTLQWASQLAPSRSLVMCGTTDGKVRLYDVNAQRRPLLELRVGHMTGAGSGGHSGVADDTPRPVACSAIAKVRGDAWGLFIGDTMGTLREYDLRNMATVQSAPVPPGRKSHDKWAHKQLPLKRGYKGIMGSIRAIDVHPNGEHLVAVGLGRFAHCYGTRRGKLTSKVYLKQKLCSVLWSADAPPPSDEGSDSGGEEDAKGNPKEDRVDEGFSDDEDAAAGEESEEEIEDAEEERHDGDEAGESEVDEEDEEEEEEDESEEPPPASKRGRRVAQASAQTSKKRRG